MPQAPSMVAGIIPARAGFTPRCGGPREARPDHPRSRGVYGPYLHGLLGDQGSSPLARGLPQMETDLTNDYRIIPARAGFTGRAFRRIGRWRGSSPLARGLHSDCGADRGRLGIIPARAGFTPSGIVLTFATRDHPRSRGVYITPLFSLIEVMGSSPLARGLPSYILRDVDGVRIIPARAGFTY